MTRLPARDVVTVEFEDEVWIKDIQPLHTGFERDAPREQLGSNGAIPQYDAGSHFGRESLWFQAYFMLLRK